MANPIPHITCTHCGSSNHNLHCTAYDVEYFTSDESFSYYHCKDCDVIFLFPQPVDQLKQIYPPNYYAFDENSRSFAFKVKSRLDRAFFKKHISSLPQSSLKVLDIGGGTGILCDIVRLIDKRVVLTQVVDIDEHAGDLAQQKGHLYFQGRMEDFHATEKYDVIIMMNLIEHVSDPQMLLQQARELLTPAGIIIIQTPNSKSLDARIFKRGSWGGYHCPRHWIIFNKENFITAAAAQQLTPAFFAYTQGAAFWAVSILNWLHKKKVIKADATKPLVYHSLFSPVSMIMALFDFARKPFSPLSQMLFVLKHDEKAKR